MDSQIQTLSIPLVIPKSRSIIHHGEYESSCLVSRPCGALSNLSIRIILIGLLSLLLIRLLPQEILINYPVVGHLDKLGVYQFSLTFAVIY